MLDMKGVMNFKPRIRRSPTVMLISWSIRVFNILGLSVGIGQSIPPILIQSGLINWSEYIFFVGPVEWVSIKFNAFPIFIDCIPSNRFNNLECFEWDKFATQLGKQSCCVKKPVNPPIQIGDNGWLLGKKCLSSTSFCSTSSLTWNPCKWT